MTELQKYYVIGNPIKHSKSPIIHNYWIKKYNINAIYDKIELKHEELDKFISDKEFNGLNITLPYKENLFNIIEYKSDSAEKIKAINTLYFKNNKLHGDNTDYIGFINNLNQNSPNCFQNIKTALILGAGGSARSIIYALKQQKIPNIFIANRTLEKAQNLANEFHISHIELEKIDQVLPQLDLLINTTSAETTNSNPLKINWDLLNKSTIVTDISYLPRQTQFLLSAQKHSLKTVDGIGMLVHQAVPAFEKWFGITPEVTQDLLDLL